jgi:hypothetical protein
LRAELLIFLIGTVDPMNRLGRAKLSHLFDPSEEVLVLTQRFGGCSHGWNNFVLVLSLS